MKRELQTKLVAIFYFLRARVNSSLFLFSLNFRRQQHIMFRSSFVEDTGNPWSPSSTYIHVGSLQNILTFAEKCGHIDRVSLYSRHSKSNPIELNFNRTQSLSSIEFELTKKKMKTVQSMSIERSIFKLLIFVKLVLKINNKFLKA